jgi:hypothetical protein
MPFDSGERSGFVISHQSAESNNVGCQNGGQSALGSGLNHHRVP